MEKQLLRKGQMLRGYLRAGTQIVVQHGKLHLQLTSHYLGELLLPQTVMLAEGEAFLIEEAGWVSCTGDSVFIIYTPPLLIKRWTWKIQQWVSLLQ
ncbi:MULTISPECIES: hypothetical protein [unclassified Iodobacter]|uniref:hypothetical protein n=1 Tax=unclassified Iodobacter TaxID=235634 RepID=UPI0025D2E736|nr:MULTISPECIES: hypothetical protein [unclassified Iodobacter]MDW5415191.1 hypothetical protein [Iodobacter sp. CM08]